MYPNRQKAKQILNEAKILNDGPWIEHSKNVAKVASIIAKYSKMDEDKAYVFGLLHDIGRRFGDASIAHALYGYLYLSQMGYDEAAKVCLTHSFNTKKTEDYHGKIDLKNDTIKRIQDALDELNYDDYDKLIQLSDSIADHNGLIDQEERMKDVEIRHGSYSSSRKEKNRELKEYFEEKIGQNIYKLINNEMIRM